MNKRKRRVIIALEIFLLIGMTFSFSYFLRESSEQLSNSFIIRERDEKNILFILRDIIFNDKNLVSALSQEDLEKGTATCLKTKDGKSCQEYPISECDGKCAEKCIPTSSAKISECKIGTCYDTIEGTCQAGSPKYLCENSKGRWFDDPNGNIAQCKRGCCLLADQSIFLTDQQCSRKSEVFGIDKIFKPEIKTEIECIAQSKNQEDGACVFESEFENTCKFTTKSNCLNLKGNFYSGYLCSYPELNSSCKKQARTGCVDGRDEIYWFDSCGNRENIYDANKAKSWNNGKVLSVSESCQIYSGNNALANQKTCGNCNYLLGSICGKKTNEERLSDSKQDYVCRDLSCIDEKGNERKNGESWCVYQGAIGVDNKQNRATDVPGSRHFRNVCIDGEIRTEPCADYRNEICVESETKVQDGTFSSAACRLNRWQECLSYNEKDKIDECSKNPDCFIKNVNVGKNFNFNICSPKYPPGFNLERNPEGAEGVCAFATQKCTVIYKKSFRWKCKINCDCEKPVFAEKMNNLCMSLGDCGAGVNYEGDYSENIKIKSTGSKTPKLSNSYKDNLKKYTIPIEGKFAEPGNFTPFSLGIPENLGDANSDDDEISNALLVPGVAGIALIWAAHKSFGVAILGKAGLVREFGTVPIETVHGIVNFPVTGPSLNALGSSLAGAGIGLAVTALLIKLLGLNLDQGVTNSLLVAGTLSGALIGYQIYLTGASKACASGGLFGCILGGIVVLIILILKLFGFGKIKKKIVTFQCQPWQPPLGGSKCSECGRDGLPCSEYSCKSLGQTCKFVNQGTGNEVCIDSDPNDVSAPVINPLYSALSQGYRYEIVSDDGVKIISKKENECIKAYEPLSFGIELDEPAQCRFDTKHTPSFDEMEFEFGGRNLFLYNHTMIFSVPNLESLGIPGYDPNRRADYALYVRCQNSRGIKNEREYTIQFCIKPGDDLTPPLITGKIPSGDNVGFNIKSQNVSVYTNEPSECKWDIRDMGYELMKNEFSCANKIEDQELLGWRCDSVFDMNKNETTFYVRCEDQPWLVEANGTESAHIIVEEAPDENDEIIDDEDNNNDPDTSVNDKIPVSNNRKRNPMRESYKIIFKKSLSPLNIDSLRPDNETIISGTPFVSVEVIAKTSGGVDGKARCSFLVGNRTVDFAETLDRTHRQVFESMTEGKQRIDIVCEDIAGNKAYKTGRFEIKIDNGVPQVTRIYNQNGVLNVITDEPSMCAYIDNYIGRGDGCSFNFDNSTLMNGNNLLHTHDFNADRTHYIKCKDRFGNVPGGCSMVVRGGV